MIVLNILCLCVEFLPIGKIAAHLVYKKVSLYKNLIFFSFWVRRFLVIAYFYHCIIEIQYISLMKNTESLNIILFMSLILRIRVVRRFLYHFNAKKTTKYYLDGHVHVRNE